MNLSALLEMLSKEGRHSEEGESNHSARAEHPQSEGSETLLAILGSICAAQLTQLGPVCNYERGVFFPWLVGWLFYFQIT